MLQSEATPLPHRTHQPSAPMPVRYGEFAEDLNALRSQVEVLVKECDHVRPAGLVVSAL